MRTTAAVTTKSDAGISTTAQRTGSTTPKEKEGRVTTKAQAKGAGERWMVEHPAPAICSSLRRRPPDQPTSVSRLREMSAKTVERYSMVHAQAILSRSAIHERVTIPLSSSGNRGLQCCMANSPGSLRRKNISMTGPETVAPPLRPGCLRAERPLLDLTQPSGNRRL